ncbi:MAG: DUF1707 domain-containing protein [Solirubrobacteraceae bacterium]
MPRRSTLRASDDDRERAADRLRHAAGEGRLLAEELEERLEGVFSARTYGELNVLVADLPAPRDRAHRHNLPVWVRASMAVALVLGVLMAVAIAAALLAAIVCLWLAWLVLSWTVLRRGRRIRSGEHSRILAEAVRHAKAGARVARGGRTAL